MTQTDWAAIVAADYAPPKGLDPALAVPELLAMLASPDPEVRDVQAYNVFFEWLPAGLFDPVIGRLGAGLMVGLRGTSSFGRSFCALVLAETLNRHAKLGLPSDLPQRALNAWRFWYPNETDVRSFEVGLGWIHAVAHGADTARALARHPHTDVRGLRDILDAITARLRSLSLYLNQTEGDRLALAMLAVLTRPEFNPVAIRAWLGTYSNLWTELTPGEIPPGPELAVRTLQSLHTLLVLGCVLGGQRLDAAYPEETLGAVQNALRTVYPFYA